MRDFRKASGFLMQLTAVVVASNGGSRSAPGPPSFCAPGMARSAMNWRFQPASESEPGSDLGMLIGILEIRWYDTTGEMTGEKFNNWLETFAACIESRQRQACLVDAVQFHMPADRMISGWREKHIIPRYNAAGVSKFAFIMPAGMPAIGSEPAVQRPARFPTGYFGERAAAVEWLCRW